MMMWIIFSKNELNVSHGNQCYYPSSVRFEESVMNIECRSYGTFENLSHPKEVESVDTYTFA